MVTDSPTTYIKLDRKILLWEWYRSATVKSMFLHLLLIAEHHDKRDEGIQLYRGQVKTTLKQLSEESGLSVKQVRNALAKLQKTGEIDVSSRPQGTIITIQNYNKYQAPKGQTNGTPRASQGQTFNYIKKDNKDKKDSSVEEDEWVYQ